MTSRLHEVSGHDLHDFNDAATTVNHSCLHFTAGAHINSSLLTNDSKRPLLRPTSMYALQSLQHFHYRPTLHHFTSVINSYNATEVGKFNKVGDYSKFVSNVNYR